MPRPKRTFHATAIETVTPPSELSPGHHIARVVKAAGNNLYDVEYPSAVKTLVEMPARFRNIIWVKRGSFVVIDTTALADRDNKLGGEISNVVRGEKMWRKMSYWPLEFKEKKHDQMDSESDEDSVVGKMPPSESDGETT